MTLKLNQPVPDFRVPATSGKDVLFSALKGFKVVLYFYPKDDTPGCTMEGQDFAARYEHFKATKTVVIGISRDSLESHEKFKCKHELPFELISDKTEALCKLFDVIKAKNMYGKIVQGVERSTFLVDDKGILRREWRKVTVKGHADEVLNAAREI